MRKLVRFLVRLLVGVVILVAATAAAGFWLLYAPTPSEPALSGRLADQTVTVGGRERGYRLYTPARPVERPPLVVVLHGTMGTPGTARVETGYEFDRLADENGFLVAYPQAVAGDWNDCRKAARARSRAGDVDDVGFMRALLARVVRDQGADPSRVFVVGLSDGGSFALRLAQEHPRGIAGAAAIGANLPTEANSICRPVMDASTPVLLINGTADPIVPYDGGEVTLFGFASRGEVMSAKDSALWFARRAGATTLAERRIQPRRPDGTSVDRAEWGTPAGPAVVLLSVNGGGHVAPQPVYRARRLLGRMTTAINGPEEAWAFFSRPPRPN